MELSRSTLAGVFDSHQFRCSYFLDDIFFSIKKKCKKQAPTGGKTLFVNRLSPKRGLLILFAYVDKHPRAWQTRKSLGHCQNVDIAWSANKTNKQEKKIGNCWLLSYLENNILGEVSERGNVFKIACHSKNVCHPIRELSNNRVFFSVHQLKTEHSQRQPLNASSHRNGKFKHNLKCTLTHPHTRTACCDKHA